MLEYTRGLKKINFIDHTKFARTSPETQVGILPNGGSDKDREAIPGTKSHQQKKLQLKKIYKEELK